MTSDPIKTVVLTISLALGAAPLLAQDKAKAGAESSAVPGKPQSKAAAPAQLVDLNSASKAELKKIPGIGDAEADRIVASRPYRTKAELVTRKLISENRYQEIKNLVVVRNPPMPKVPVK